ncbi:MAG: hypothetical protein QOE58_2865, partial [Actinomycetota bacterium]|nr:hypothetical protein [Actinomycetota bacterium]
MTARHKGSGRRSRPRTQVALNVPLFLVGLALILGATVGVEVGSIKLAGLGSWWIRGTIVLVGVGVTIFSFFVTEPAPGEPATSPIAVHRAPPPLAPLVSGTSLMGDVPALPARFVARPDVFDAIRNGVLLHETVALVGMGGAGKTILATAIARDQEVQVAFPDGIAWVSAGQQASPKHLQELLAELLSGQAASFSSIESGRNRLAELLAGRACLLVVDDIWDPGVLHALSVVGPPQGTMLFTTRERSIARSIGAKTQDVDKLGLEQALALLGRWTGTEFDQLPPEADSLCLRVDNLALGVALVGGMVASRGAQPHAWADVLGRLEDADVDAIADEYGPDGYQHRSVLASITVSIQDLDEADRRRFHELAVFAGRGGVPLTAVSALLSSADFDGRASEDLLTRLTGRSLAQRDARGWVSLHDLLYEVATHQLASNTGGLAAAHGRLVDGYRLLCGSVSATDNSTIWAGGPDDGYFFQNLAYHLGGAGYTEELDRLLASFSWLERDIAVAGISELLGDYTHQTRAVDVDVIHGALQLSAQILATSSDLLAGQLVGRLLGRSELSVETLVADASAWEGGPWLCPEWPGSLTEPGGPLERTLEGHARPVQSVALTPDGLRIVSGGSEGSVKVWNLASGRLERT